MCVYSSSCFFLSQRGQCFASSVFRAPAHFTGISRSSARPTQFTTLSSWDRDTKSSTACLFRFDSEDAAKEKEKGLLMFPAIELTQPCTKPDFRNGHALQPLICIFTWRGSRAEQDLVFMAANKSCSFCLVGQIPPFCWPGQGALLSSHKYLPFCSAWPTSPQHSVR